jgi:hypothetical protein
MSRPRALLDAVHALNTTTGRPITTVSFADQGAERLNAIAQSPVDHAIYIPGPAR